MTKIVSVDRAGRIVIPKVIRELAGFTEKTTRSGWTGNWMPGPAHKRSGCRVHGGGHGERTAAT